MSGVVSRTLLPFQRTYRFFQRHAHENPVILWASIIGLSGPLIFTVVPPIRHRLGYRPPEPIPTSYPPTVPQRTRRQVHGYEDE